MLSSFRKEIYMNACKQWNGKERMGNLDVLRCMAALAVICIHVITSPVENYDGVLSSGLLWNIQCIHSLMKWSVPVFFIMTGYFCGKHETYTYNFALKKILKFVCTLFTVGFSYALLECVFTTRHLGINEIGLAVLNVFNGKLWNHMWFVYDIIGIYLVLPVLFSFFSRSHEQYLFVAFLFVFTILLPWVGKNTIVNVNINFPMGGYLFYVCFGMLLSICPINRINKYTKSIISCALILIGIIPPLLGYEQTGYNDPFVCFLATGLFTLFLELRISSTKGIAVLAGCTWGIYLIHPLYINMAVKLLHMDFLSGMAFVRLFFFYLAIVFVSFFSVYLLKRIRFVKWLF